MDRLPMKKLTKYQFAILGNLIAYCVLNGLDPLTQKTQMDGRIAKGLIKAGYCYIASESEMLPYPIYGVTSDGTDAYWRQKRA